MSREQGARRALILPVSVPAHSSLMRAAGEALQESLGVAKFEAPGITVMAASTATPYADAQDIRERLSRQVYAPVQWVNTIHAMTAAGATSVIECGPGKVLAGLMRRIDKTTPCACINSVNGLQAALQIEPIVQR